MELLHQNDVINFSLFSSYETSQSLLYNLSQIYIDLCMLFITFGLDNFVV